ncbi:hypothetical protein ACJRO7_000151 [Eucalyptus globulus]|uniref:Uncharacterized protein n=1 Tax=Eucalyptus globulus TaxID=34317 RepID=A0ABD3LWF9_EUCGL
MASNISPELQQSSAMVSSPNQSFAGRTGDTQVPDLELAIQRPTDMSNGYLNSSAPDNSLVEGDLNAPPRAHNGDPFSSAFDVSLGEVLRLFRNIVAAVLVAALLIYLALKHPSPVVIISASLFTVVVSVTLFLLQAGWTRRNGKMFCIGSFLAYVGFCLALFLSVLAMTRFSER